MPLLYKAKQLSQGLLREPPLKKLSDPAKKPLPFLFKNHVSLLQAHQFPSLQVRFLKISRNQERIPVHQRERKKIMREKEIFEFVAAVIFFKAGIPNFEVQLIRGILRLCEDPTQEKAH